MPLGAMQHKASSDSHTPDRALILGRALGQAAFFGLNLVLLVRHLCVDIDA